MNFLKQKKGKIKKTLLVFLVVVFRIPAKRKVLFSS